MMVPEQVKLPLLKTAAAHGADDTVLPPMMRCGPSSAALAAAGTASTPVRAVAREATAMRMRTPGSFRFRRCGGGHRSRVRSSAAHPLSWSWWRSRSRSPAQRARRRAADTGRWVDRRPYRVGFARSPLRGPPNCAPTQSGVPVARVVVDVMLKPEILDPQGQAVANALPRLGVGTISSVRIGRRIEIEFDGEPDLETAREIADKLLANPVIEDFSIRVEEPAGDTAQMSS